MPLYWHACANALAQLCQRLGRVVPIRWHNASDTVDVYRYQDARLQADMLLMKADLSGII